MVRPSFRETSANTLSAELALCARAKSGIFLGKWHKKVAGLREKHSQAATCTVQGTASSARMHFSLARQPLAGREIVFNATRLEML
jgi:hypothetical protein